MLPSTDPVASYIPALSLETRSDNTMAALYRMALGPVNTDQYLPIFARFDTTGRTMTSWNWAACLATINWMVFRQLWGAALVYLAAAEGLALLVFGVGRTFLQWPQGVEWGVLGAFALVAFAVPGLYGNAILHADIRKRIARALAASRTVPEASALLERQASSRQRLRTVVLANLALVAVAALAYALLPGTTSRPATEPELTVAQAASAAAAAAAATTAPGATAAGKVSQAAPAEEVPAVQEAAPPASAPASAPAAAPAASAPAAPASAAAAPSGARAPASAPAAAPASVPAPTATASAPPAPPAPAAPASRAPTAAASTPAATTPPASQASAPTAKASATPPPRREAASRPAPTAKPKAGASAATAPAAAPQAAASTVGSAPGYYINVGLFAEEANARKAQARLLNEGLPAFRQELHSGSKARRIRVRVGPYDSRAQADAAAESIRAMALEAVVFKQ